jgi:hypothetical protein
MGVFLIHLLGASCFYFLLLRAIQLCSDPKERLLTSATEVEKESEPSIRDHFTLISGYCSQQAFDDFVAAEGLSPQTSHYSIKQPFRVGWEQGVSWSVHELQAPQHQLMAGFANGKFVLQSASW